MIQAFYKFHVGYILVTKLTPLRTPFMDILSMETTLLDVIISIIGFQFKDAINVTTTWMMLGKSNEVTNVGKAQFTKLVLDVLQLLTFEKLYYAIIIIIEQMPSQEGLVNT
jgi:hypothetical protein